MSMMMLLDRLRQQQSVSTPPFSIPSSGLVLHLEPNSGVITSGDDVTSWEDQSGSGNDLTAVGAPKYLINQLNGQPVIDFDGFDDELVRVSGISNMPSGNSDRSVFLVANYRSNGYGGFAWGNNSTGQTFGPIVSNTGFLTIQRWSFDHISTTAGTNAGWLIQSVVLNSTGFIHYKDGTQIDTGTNNFNTNVQKIALAAEIDGNPEIDMQVAEVIVYNREITTIERTDIESYLSAKYFGT